MQDLSLSNSSTAPLLAWNQAPQWGKKGKNGVKMRSLVPCYSSFGLLILLKQLHLKMLSGKR